MVKVERAAEELAQGLRRSHCARGDNAEHDCVGTCTITRDGVQLDCRVCGHDSQPIAPVELLPSTRAAKAIVEAAGMDWRALNSEAKRDAVAALERFGFTVRDPAR